MCSSELCSVSASGLPTPRSFGFFVSTRPEYTGPPRQLFSGVFVSVSLALLDGGIPHELTEKRLKLNAELVRPFPGVRFEVDDQPIEATVFPTDGIRQAPMSPVAGRPTRRADAGEVEALLAPS